MKDWVKYYNTPVAQRERVLNVISLEFSITPLAEEVRPPAVVKELDWIKMWPRKQLAQGNWPRVQNYCLMSTANCYTDFHIDLGGTSVWYHVHTGEKQFIFAPPTKINMRAYEQWSMTPKQKRKFLPDIIRDCFVVTLKEGQTMLIPTGWIHAVYTPYDSLIFGGNFLHSLDIAGQLRIYALECHSQVPRKYLLPLFEEWHWYVAGWYLNDLRRGNVLEKRMKDVLYCLVGTLASWHADALADRQNEWKQKSLQAAKEAAQSCNCIGPLDMLAELGARGRGDAWSLPPSGEGLNLQEFYGHDDSDSHDEEDAKGEKKRKRAPATHPVARTVKLKLNANNDAIDTGNMCC